MKQKFREIRLSAANRVRLETINAIIREYQAQGYKLTLRQLYYQLVSRDIIPNKLAEYSKLSTLLKEGRMGGVVDWNAIEDRLRVPSKPSSWDNVKDIMESAIASFEMPRMKEQENYVEVWVEKDALSGVLKTVTEPYHIPILVNRGYSSASAMYDAYNRFSRAMKAGQTVTILYLGDYDPSGIDMIRDIRDRILEMLLNCDVLLNKAEDAMYEMEWQDRETLQDELRDKYQDIDEHPNCFQDYEDDDTDDDGQSMKGAGFFSVARAFIKDRFAVRPIALTIEQIRQYNPPPNPAKITDPRAAQFIAEKGKTSWEVDALKPQALNAILNGAIKELIDFEKYKAVVESEKSQVAKLEKLMEKL